jgi:hypothetical protein
MTPPGERTVRSTVAKSSSISGNVIQPDLATPAYRSQVLTPSEFFRNPPERFISLPNKRYFVECSLLINKETTVAYLCTLGSMGGDIAISMVVYIYKERCQHMATMAQMYGDGTDYYWQVMPGNPRLSQRINVREDMGDWSIMPFQRHFGFSVYSTEIL